MKVPQPISDGFNKIKHKSWFHWLVATVVLFSMSWFFMGSGLTSCTTSTPAFGSDTTGGIAWFQSASGNDLGWNYTTQSNYPVGEQLDRPQAITAEAFSLLYKLLATLTTPICGVNLMILLGYMSTGLVMFGFMRWLFRRNSIALLAAYAAAFVPYHQLKAQGHVVYMYGSIFIAIAWAFMWFTEKPSYRRALVIAALTALSAYIDGYFVLLAGVLIGCLIGFSLLRKGAAIRGAKRGVSVDINYKNIFQNIRNSFVYLVLIGIGVIVMVLPIAHTLRSQGPAIKQSLAASRGNIFVESATYGAHLYDFVTPPFNSLFMPDGYGAWRQAHNHFSNASEATLYIGWALLLLAIASLVLLLFKNVRSIRVRPNLTLGFIIGLLAATIAVCLVFAIPSKMTLFNHTFRTPLWYFVNIIENWRVFARFFLVIHPLIVVLAASCLFVLSKRLSYKHFMVVLLAVFGVTFFEYLPSPVRPGGDINKNSPAIYSQLRDDQSVKAIVEYPLTDLAYTPSTFTFQQLHKKPVFNANDSAIILSPLNRSIAAINDEQALGILKARGVTHILTYELDLSSNSMLTPYGPQNNRIRAYSINQDVAPRYFALVPQAGFEYAGIEDNQVSHHVVATSGSLRITDIDNQIRTPSKNVLQTSFDIKAFTKDDAEVTLMQNGQVLWTGTATQDTGRVRFEAQKGDITIQASRPVDISNFSGVE